MDEQVKLLLDDLERNIARVDGDRKFSRGAASVFRGGTIFLGALTTVLLGTRGNVTSFAADAFNVTALIASAIITAAASWESFADYRGRWVRKRTTLSGLMNIRDDLKFAVASGSPLGTNRLTGYRDRYNNCLADEHRLWLAERPKSIARPPNGEGAE